MMIQPLSFDTNLFGYPVAFINWRCQFLEEEFLKSVKKFQLVYIFSDKPISFSDSQILHVDTKITYSKELTPRSNLKDIQISPNLRPTELSSFQLESLRNLALESGKYSRFKIDPRLYHLEFEKLYNVWIDKAINLRSILIADDLAGLITFDSKKEIAKIGLIAVHPEHRNQGLGEKLVISAENFLSEKGAKTLKVPTQESNGPAQALYQKLGYEISEKVFVYHYWRGSL